MIDEDLRIARQRACRWEELNERRQSLADLVRMTRQAVGARDLETVAAEDAKLGALVVVLAAVEQELAGVGPARELYEELLAREERRLIESTDPRGAELLEIRQLLTELAIELPARERARRAGQEALHRWGDRAAQAAFVREAEALGMMIDPATADPVSGHPVSGHPGSVGSGSDGFGGVRLLVELLEERCAELERLRDELRTRREKLLLD
ncbi:hypothetical protein ABGB18_23545 [Nonomuraea sp. B12E4]|uniref:hypothetical protein n=1 Tax=Nonomuraea sp. B12E4 TaxID=3153564 RepID=UPI00325E9C2B